MDKLVIRGGKRLKGSVEISGAKNAALPIMAASLLSAGYSNVLNVPGLKDIMTMGRLLANLGAGFHFEGPRIMISTEKIRIFEAPYDLVRTMRASILVLGPLLARYGKAKGIPSRRMRHRREADKPAPDGP